MEENTHFVITIQALNAYENDFINGAAAKADEKLSNFAKHIIEGIKQRGGYINLDSLTTEAHGQNFFHFHIFLSSVKKHFELILKVLFGLKK